MKTPEDEVKKRLESSRIFKRYANNQAYFLDGTDFSVLVRGNTAYWKKKEARVTYPKRENGDSRNVSIRYLDVTFESVLLNVPKAYKKELIFLMDLFQKKKS